MSGKVLILDCGGEPTALHERQRHESLARIIGEIKGYPFGGAYDASGEHNGHHLYFVPHRTIVGIDTAANLGIKTADDLYGGVVPDQLVATKAIMHRSPEGWNSDLAKSVEEYLLPGFTAFTREDACESGRRLLDLGSVRLKDIFAVGGKGQTVARNAREFEAALQKFPIVVEVNLEEITTYSIGQVHVDGLTVSYWGTQRTTLDNSGGTAYGGSDLHLVRGEFGNAVALAPTAEAKLAVNAAKAFDAAAHVHYPGMFASRRNYDVASGCDARGVARCGVIDQSWRIGGASGVEILALRIFKERPDARSIKGSTFNVYGRDATAPPHATVHFRGIDDRGGPMITYTVIESVR